MRNRGNARVIRVRGRRAVCHKGTEEDGSGSRARVHDGPGSARASRAAMGLQIEIAISSRGPAPAT